MRTRLLLSTLALVLAVIPGCRKDPAANQASAPGTPAPGTATGAAAVKPVPVTLPDVVARVNGEPVGRDELELALRNLEGRTGTQVPPEQRDQVYRDLLERIIGYHLLAQESRARKFVAPPWDVDQRIAQFRQQFPSEQAFNEMLAQRGITIDRLRQEAADAITVNQMLEKEFESSIAASDADVRKFYDENPAQFREQETVRASHILIRVDQNADAAAKAQARARLAGLEAQIRKGADFAALARQHSQDPGSAQNGGDLGFFARGQMVPAFEEAAFATKPGALSPIVESPFGFHLIRVAERRPARVVPFDDVKERVREYLKQQLREQKSQSFIQQLRTKGKVEVLI